LPQGPLWRKHAGGPERAQNRQKAALVADRLLQKRSNPRADAVPKHSNRRIMTSHGLAAARVIAARGVETHYALTTALRTTAVPGSIKAYSAGGR